MADLSRVESDSKPEIVDTSSHEANAHVDIEKHGVSPVVDSTTVVHAEDKIIVDAATVQAVSRGLQPPAFLLNMTAEERINMEKRLMRKIDTRLLPMIILMYILNYIDRNNISAATLGGLKEDLHLSSTQFLTAVSILFVG